MQNAQLTSDGRKGDCHLANPLLLNRLLGVPGDQVGHVHLAASIILELGKRRTVAVPLSLESIFGHSHADPFFFHMIAPSGEETDRIALAPKLHLGVPFVGLVRSESGRGFGGEMGGATGEEERVLGTERGNEGHATGFVVKLRHHISHPFFAKRELSRFRRLVELVNVARNVVGVHGLGEANTCRSMVVLKIGIAIHEEHLRRLPLVSSVCEPQCLVCSGVGVGVGDGIHRTGDNAGRPREHGGERQLEDLSLKIGGIIGAAEGEAEGNVGIAVIVDVAPHRVVIPVGPLDFVTAVRPPNEHLSG